MGHGYYTWEFMLRQTMERHHIGLMDAVIILELNALYARAMDAPGAREPQTSQSGPKQSER